MLYSHFGRIFAFQSQAIIDFAYYQYITTKSGWGKLLFKVTKLRYTSYSALVTGSSVTVPLLSDVIDPTK